MNAKVTVVILCVFLMAGAFAKPGKFSNSQSNSNSNSNSNERLNDGYGQQRPVSNANWTPVMNQPIRR
uniref:Male accessory gland secretory protein n=1 Tax=Syphacia muris TaxID=451379 RepID=A0A0N5AWP1_9BILA